MLLTKKALFQTLAALRGRLGCSQFFLQTFAVQRKEKIGDRADGYNSKKKKKVQQRINEHHGG